MTTTKLCMMCDGSGEIREKVGHHNTEYEYHKCKKCNGTGRIIEGTYTITFPFDIEQHKLNEADSKIHQLIRELQITNTIKII